MNRSTDGRNNEVAAMKTLLRVLQSGSVGPLRLGRVKPQPLQEQRQSAVPGEACQCVHHLVPHYWVVDPIERTIELL